MVGAARVRERQSLRAEVCERREPTAEERAHRVVALHVDAAYSARAVVEVEVGGELFVLRLRREARARRGAWRGLRRRLSLPRLGGGRRWSGRGLRRLKFSEVLFDVRVRAEESFLLAAPQSDANRASRL